MTDLSLIDFFCGAGGFSEGFKQLGFKVVAGYDKWGPAVETFNHNFQLQNKPKNILDFEDSIEEINEIPDTEVILGSPPCVSFSNSNNSGKADKSMGLRLTEVFLKIVAVKKHQPNSKLKAWFMENVPNSLKYIEDNYTFNKLGLSDWAVSNDLDPYTVAIQIKGNSYIINSADYGSPQSRKRAITGEFVGDGSLVLPEKTHISPGKRGILPEYRKLTEVRSALPNPFAFSPTSLVKDPTYGIKLTHEELTDQFYDTGLYECQWRNSEFQKTNHPYMGRMSFPENENNPSRTICATNIGTSRESLIYTSEYRRTGNGQYRTPTVREAACIMGFPITYQFLGAETSKWRLVGNAVTLSVSRAFAKLIRQKLERVRYRIRVSKTPRFEGIENLNSEILQTFDNPPKKNSGARFRRHPFKYGNITVTLSNYNIEDNKNKERWITSVQYGNGDGFPTHNYPDGYYSCLEKTIRTFERGKEFLQIVNNGFSERIASKDVLQRMYETRLGEEDYLEPTELVEHIARLIKGFSFEEADLDNPKQTFFKKSIVPKKQVMALYAINKVSSTANNI